MTPRVRELIEDMLDTMYEANGVGLAAPQVGVLKRVVVIDVTGEDPHIFINPRIVETSGVPAQRPSCAIYHIVFMGSNSNCTVSCFSGCPRSASSNASFICISLPRAFMRRTFYTGKCWGIRLCPICWRYRSLPVRRSVE